VEREIRPWYLYFNLLGLDAPLIAVTWLFLFARTWRVDYHPWEAYAALGLSVWTIRIAVKLVQESLLSEPHAFAAIHESRLRMAAVTSGLLAIVLIVRSFPLSLYAYLMVCALIVVGYFAILLFSEPKEGGVNYTRHILSALSFAFGTALTAHVYLPSQNIFLMMITREFLCFGLLCILASTALELWTRPKKSNADAEAWSMDELTLSLPLTLLGAAALVFAAQDELMAVRPFYYGILTGAALLQVLNRTRGRFEPETLKLLIALCLLVPGIVFQSYPAPK
jgi:hypothetical protein